LRKKKGSLLQVLTSNDNYPQHKEKIEKNRRKESKILTFNSKKQNRQL